MASIDFINECKNYAYENRYGKLILGEPTTAEISSSVSITNAQASRLLETKMSKLSTQETTTGSQLFNAYAINTTGINVTNDGATITMPIVSTGSGYKTTKKLSVLCPSLQVGDSVYIYFTCTSANNKTLYTTDGTYWANGGNKTITQNMLDATFVLYSNNYTQGETEANVYSNLRIVKTQNAPFEKFTNGPSPNPEYPQTVNTVKTSVSITISDGTNTNTETIPLGDNEICGIGDYKDELIVDSNGKCWLNKKIGKVVLNGEENWTKRTDISLANVSCFRSKYSDDVGNNMLSNAIQLSDRFICEDNFNNEEHIRPTGSSISYRFQLFINKLRLNSDDGNGLSEWLSNNNTIVYYVLNEPTLIDLNYNVDLTLYEGTNTITNSEDMDMEIIYKASVELNQSNKIQEFTIDSGCYDNGNIVGSVYVTKLNAQLIDALDNTLENVDCDASVGVTYTTVEEIEGEEVETETTEYVKLGSYVVEKPKDEQTTNYSSFVAYDLLMNHLEEKYSTSLDYENDTITIADVYNELCSKLGLTPVTTTFTNSTITVENNPFNNGEINRTVLQAICKVACAFINIDYDTNEIDLKWLSNTLDYTFQKSDYSTVEGGKTVYGPVNSLIIKNSVIDSENVSYSDSVSILQNGDHQLVISEDYFLYNQEKRTEALTAIWNKVNGLTYTECTLNTSTGKPFLKVGSKIRIYTDTNEYFDSYVLQNEFKYDGTFSNVIKCPVLTKQEVQTKQNVDLGYRVKQTEIIVDKQNGMIEEITGQINDANTAIDGIRTTQNATERRIDVISSNIDENGNITEVTTVTGFTFNSEGMHISGDGFEANHTSQGTYYKDGDAIVGQYTKDGSKQKDLELFGTYSYGKNDINDEPMFIAQLYTDENGEEGFGHFSNVE